ncbi:hypothetical protein E2C01_092571 [Portunus trituberculatus]|uniref:Uncharacterized protein n=1 Tax=Portunus trituberculatus TaxID=210409 RepID=A0A5B7JSE1_PORTR|nr:hypothetical protein [Portunus trituberculatus]
MASIGDGKCKDKENDLVERIRIKKKVESLKKRDVTRKELREEERSMAGFKGGTALGRWRHKASSHLRQQM